MFKITIEGATLSELASSVLALAGQFQTTAAPQDAKPVAKSRKAAGSAATADSASSAASVDAGSTDDKPVENQSAPDEDKELDASDHPIELGAIKERALLYSQKAGPTVIGEMLQNAGAPTGKFSEIGENMDALKKVSDALAAAGY